MEKFLEGKVALVTGSGQGIGRAVAMALAEAGATVVTNNRRKGQTDTKQLSAEQIATLSPEEQAQFKERLANEAGDAETTAQAIIEKGGSAKHFFADISDFAAAEELVKFVVKECGHIDIVANVAGGFGFGSVTKITEEVWDRVNKVKPKGYFNIIHFAAPYMMEQKWGRIINCSSRAFLGDWILHPEYCAANAGVVGLTRAVAIELWPYNITCNSFDPFARTRAGVELDTMAHKLKGGDPMLMPGTPIPDYEFMPSPDYLAPFLTYLCTEDAKEISGCMFSLAGNSIGRYYDSAVEASITKFGPEKWTYEELKRTVPMNLMRGYKSIADPSNRH